MNLSDFQDNLNAVVSEYNFSGATACLSVDGSVQTCSTGFVNDDKDIPYSSETLVRVGCLTKVFIATQIMILVDEGKVSLESSLATLIP